MDLLLHPRTHDALLAFIANPSHALLLTGESGSGKGTLANYIAEKLLDVHGPAHIKSLGTAEGPITIDQVRDVIHFTQLSVPGSRKIKRCIIIENAQRMGQEAQNALLKLLEEPPADTVLLLTVPSSHSVLQTIRSRTQILQVLPVTLESSLQYFGKDKADASIITRNYFLSAGHVGLLKALLDEPDHPLVKQIETAKNIVSASLFERLSLVDSLAKNRDSLETLLLAIVRVTDAALQQAVRTNTTKNISRLTKSVRAAITAKDSLPTNPNNKLLLSDLMLNI